VKFLGVVGRSVQANDKYNLAEVVSDFVEVSHDSILGGRATEFFARRSAAAHLTKLRQLEPGMVLQAILDDFQAAPANLQNQFCRMIRGYR
jgi:hypothetical protein